MSRSSCTNAASTVLPWALLRMRYGACALVGLAAFYPTNAWAHGDAHITPDTLWQTWNWQPSLLLSLALLGILYGRGVLRLWKRAGTGQGIRRWQVGAFAGGLIALFVALVSPLEALGGVLFSAHMAQHLTLILIAAPLLVLGTPILAFLWNLSPDGRKAVGRWWNGSSVAQSTWHIISNPLLVWVFYAATIWVWHAPGPYQAALRDSFLHEVEHINFIVASGLFCWTLVSPMGRRRISRGMGVIYLFTTSLHGSLLGALLTFTPTPWYEDYIQTTPEWGLSPLADQQLAGLIMWIPMGMLYASLAALLFVMWIKDMEANLHGRDSALIPALPDQRMRTTEGD